MKLTNLKWLGTLAVAALPLYLGYSQDAPVPAAPPTPPAVTPPLVPAPNAPSPAAPTVRRIVKPSGDKAEVLKLTKAGVGEDVVMAYIKNSRSFFNLSADDVLHLRDEGVSSAVVSAMLNHDHALRSEGPNRPAAPFNYNQQTYPPGSQPPPGQTIAPPPPEPDGSAGTTAQIVTPPLVPGGPQDGSQPPPAQVEVVPVAPGPDYYWAPGYWGWNGGWIWIGGGWFPHGRFGWGWPGWGRGFHGGWGGGFHGGGFHGGGGGWGRGGGGGGHGH